MQLQVRAARTARSAIEAEAPFGASFLVSQFE
jgi:hypothetical protein